MTIKKKNIIMKWIKRTMLAIVITVTAGFFFS
jgi:hypothetical protein